MGIGRQWRGGGVGWGWVGRWARGIEVVAILKCCCVISDGDGWTEEK